MIEIRNLINEYVPDYDIFTEDDECMTALKQAVQNLNEANKIIFVLYAESGSLREVGKMLGVSHTSVYKVIKQIKNEIKEWCIEHYPNNDNIKNMFGKAE